MLLNEGKVDIDCNVSQVMEKLSSSDLTNGLGGLGVCKSPNLLSLLLNAFMDTKEKPNLK